MRYGTVAIGEICKYITSGGTPRSNIKEYYFPPEVPWLKTKEVNYFRIYETETYISKEGLQKSSAKLIPENSIIVAMYGQGDTAGRVAINKIPLATNQACCNLIIDPQKADYEYVYYAMVTLYEKIVSLKNGGAQPNLNAKIIREIEIPFPDIETQHRIADILSAYDDLIENNKKQIKLLEEAAQRLYKEWFVDLHFPGYENTKIIEGIPEGWKKSSLEEICELQETIISVEELALNCPYIGLEHMPRKDFCLASFGQAQDSCGKKYFFEEDDIIFAKIRPYFHKVGFAITSGVVSLDSFVIKSQKGFWGLLLMTMFSEDFVNYSYRTCKEGAKMPRADWNQMKKYYVKIPDDQIRKEFEENIWSITRQIKVLAFQNKNLLEARDRLLPKLIQGEIDL